MEQTGGTIPNNGPISRWRSLTTRMIMGTVLLVVPTLLGGMWLSLQRHVAMELEQVEGDVQHIADTVVQSFEYASPPGGSVHRRHIERALGDLQLVQNVQLVAHDGNVVFSRNPEEIGTVIPTTRREPCNSCHINEGEPPVAESLTYVADDGTPIFHQSYPVPNQPMCHRCHVADMEELGTLLISFDQSDVRAEVRQFRVSAGVTIGLAILVLMGGITLLFNRLVGKPLEIIADDVRRVEMGDLEIGATSDKADELGELHRAFGRMTGKLAEHETLLQNKVKRGAERVEALTKRLVTIDADLTRLQRLSALGAISAKVVHEVRTPLNALSLNLQMLRRTMSGQDQTIPGVLELTENAHQEIERISAVLTDFMQRAKVPRAAFVEEDVDDLVRGVLMLLAADAGEAGVDLTYRVEEDLGRQIVAADSIRQILINLVSNGLVATKDGGEIHVEVTRPTQDRLRLVVSDQGIGIAEAELARIFEPFYTTRPGGTGLGLPVIRQILDQMSGTISVDSQPGEGTRVTVNVPIRVRGGDDGDQE